MNIFNILREYIKLFIIRVLSKKNFTKGDIKMNNNSNTSQITDTILMIKPVAFNYNAETASITTTRLLLRE